MSPNFEFSRNLAEANVPFFNSSMLIWAGAFIVLSIIFSIMTWRAQRGLGSRSAMYWVANALLLCIGIYFFTRAFPRLSAGWVLAGLFFLIFAISGMTVATKSKSGSGDKKEGEKGANAPR